MATPRCLLTFFTALSFAGVAVPAELRGVLLKADADKKEITVEARGRGVRGKTMTFLLDKDTQIRIGKETVKLGDLVVGKRVRVQYEVQAGQRTAVLITQLGIAATAAAPAPPTGDGLSGILRRVALTDREIVVITPGAAGKPEAETTLAVPTDARITKAQKAIRFDDLQEEEQVVVRPEKRNGRLIARTIEVVAAAPGKASGPGDDRLERLREILKMVDFFLRMVPRKS